MTDEKILIRISKLLAMAQDTSSPHEAAIAAKRAASLMMKHNLAEADVIIKEIGDDDITKEYSENRSRAKMPRWMESLAVPVGNLMDCAIRKSTYYGGSTNVTRMCVVTYLGQKDDAQVAAWIFDYLIDQIKRLAKKRRVQLRKQYGAGHGVNMEDYRMGVVHEILRTLAEMKREKEDALKVHSTGTALVVLKGQLIEKKFGETSYGKMDDYGVEDNANYTAGRIDGQKVRINQAIGADEPKERIQ